MRRPLYAVAVVGLCAAFRPVRPRAVLSSARRGVPVTTDAEAAEAATAADPRPGFAENALFDCDDSVGEWAAFQADGPASAVENLRRAAGVAASRATGGGRALAYWAGHAARTAYFVGNALAGTAGFNAKNRLQRGDQNVGAVAGFGDGSRALLGLDAAVATRLVLEAMLTFEQDWRAIDADVLKMPWDMTPTHRQSTPTYSGLQTLRFLREASATLGRRAAKAAPRTAWPGEDEGDYPEYYLNDFHYQSDGWLSERSANVYETSTETLFVGRQDAMQRQTLLPLAKRPTAPTSILEVACGTGRFATFARDRFPDARMTVVDLSRPYLAKARENDAYWRSRRARNARPAEAVRANAESLPFDDAQFDAVTCVYLFHELPGDARAAVAREIARVVKPGGTVVLTDSIQRGDRPALDANLDLFEYMNEPHYAGYVREDLPALFKAAGLECGEKYVASTSKSLSFTKPPEAARAATPV